MINGCLLTGACAGCPSPRPRSRRASPRRRASRTSRADRRESACRRRCSTMRPSSTTMTRRPRKANQPDRAAAAAVRHQRAGRGGGTGRPAVNPDALEPRPDQRGRCRRSGIGQRQPRADGNRRPPATRRSSHDPRSQHAARRRARWPRGLRPCRARRCRCEASFRLGDAGVLCTAQIKPTDPRLTGIFDRSYQLTCRDAAAPVGSVLALRRASIWRASRARCRSGR